MWTSFALPQAAVIVALFAVSLDLILGYTGIVSLGHAAFLGLGDNAAAFFLKLVIWLGVLQRITRWL